MSTFGTLFDFTFITEFVGFFFSLIYIEESFETFILVTFLNKLIKYKYINYIIKILGNVHLFRKKYSLNNSRHKLHIIHQLIYIRAILY